MRRGRVLLLVGLIFIVIVAAAFVVLQQGLLAGSGPTVVQPVVEPTEPPVKVYRLVQRVPRGGEITEDVVQLVQINQENLLEGMYQEGDQENLIGRRARFDLVPPLYLSNNLVVDLEDLSDTGSDVALLIPKGMVAVSVPISRLSSVAYALERGDHVNVIVTLLFVDLDANFQSVLPNNTAAVLAPGPNALISSESVLGGQSTTPSGEEATVTAQGQAADVFVDELIQSLTAQTASGGALSPVGRLEIDNSLGQPFYIVPSESQRPRLVSQTLIEDVIVLQLGDFEKEQLLPEDPAAPAEGEEAVPVDQGGEAVVPEELPPDVITLVVSPQDAVTLNYLLYSGAQLSLAMRASQDTSRANTEAVTLNFLLDQYRIQVPVKLPFGLEPGVNSLTPPVLKNDFVPPPEN